MSIETIYTCDKCDCRQHSEEQFWVVGVDYYPFRTGKPFWGRMKKMHVCRPCLESFGLVPQSDTATPIPAPPSTEELIAQIIARCTE